MLGDGSRRARLTLRFAFVAELYLYAASYGMHEPADFVHATFCGDDAEGRLCESVAYHDDTLSHGLFFVGLVALDVVLLLAQAAAAGAGAELAGSNRTIVIANASIVAIAIVANLGFEPIGLDLVVVALVAALAVYLLHRCGPRALIVYFAWAYVAGLAATLAVKLG